MAESVNKGNAIMLSGNLEDVPFGCIFYQLVREKKSGYLDILTGPPPQGKIVKRIIFYSGANFYAQGGAPEETIARILVAKGKISEQKYEDLKAQTGGDYKKLEELAQAEAKLSAQELAEIYEYQVEFKLINCFALIKGYYQFKEIDAKSLQKNPLIPLSPEKLMLSGVKTHYPKARIDKEFAGIEKKNFKVKPELKEKYADFGFGPREIRWMNQLGKEFSFINAVRSSSLKPEQAMQTILALYMAGFLELPAEEQDFPLGRAYEGVEPKVKKVERIVEEKKPVVEEKKPEVKKEEPKLPIEEMLDREMTDQELIKEIDKMLEIVSKKESTFFDIMGVNETVPPARVKKIYFKMARIFHPDAKPDLYKGELREKVEDLFTKISEAYNTLTEPELRRAYLDRLKAKVTEEDMEKANRAIQAEMELQKAMIAMRRGAFKEARASLETAVDLVPDEPEFKIHLGYCVFKTEGVGSASKAARMIEEALKQRDKVAEGWYYLGVLNRVMGNLGDAKGCFEKTLELDKYHQEAQRELRVIEMKLAEARSGKKR